MQKGRAVEPEVRRFARPLCRILGEYKEVEVVIVQKVKAEEYVDCRFPQPSSRTLVECERVRL